MARDSHRSRRLDVKGTLLHWAMERSNKSAEDLAKKPNLRKLSEWLAGTRKPTRPQLEAFAKATYTPFGYLLLSKPPNIQPSLIPHFRTIDSGRQAKRSLDLEDTIKIVKRRQDWVRNYLMEVGAKPLGFVGSGAIDHDPVETAGMIRMELGLRQNWAARFGSWKSAQKRLQQKIEDMRIFVSIDKIVKNNRNRQLDPNEFRGFVLVDDYAPFVFVNKADFEGAQMFTLAHELAHVWIGESASFDLHHLASNPHNKLELACNRIAAEFLVPTKELLQQWDLFVESPDDTYKAASQHFKVSRIVAARRALDTSCITEDDFNKFYKQYKEAHRKQEQLKKNLKNKQNRSFYSFSPSRVSKRFLQTVITAVGERKILYREAYSLTDLKLKSFDIEKKKK